MFSASISPAILRDCILAWDAGLHPDFRSGKKSGTVALAHSHVCRQVVSSEELAIGRASLSAFSVTSPSCPVAVEGRVSAFEILKIQCLSTAWMCPDRARETPGPTRVIHTILLLSQWRESCIFPGLDAASLRRLTKPLRVFPRRRLSRGACRPPSIPPASAAFERVHARAGVGSAP